MDSPSDNAAAELLAAVRETLEDAGLDPSPQAVRLVSGAVLVLAERVCRDTWQAALARLGSSADAVAILRKLAGDDTALRADARVAGLHPEALRRASQRLEKLLREKV